MFETGMSALVLKICSEYAKALGLNFPPCVQQEINAIAQYVDLHTVKDLTVEQDGSVVTITCYTEGEQEKVFTITLPEINVDTLSALIKGSSTVVVDKSEDGSTLVVRLDKSQEVQYVTLSGDVVTDEQVAILKANKENCVVVGRVVYRYSSASGDVYQYITAYNAGLDFYKIQMIEVDFKNKTYKDGNIFIQKQIEAIYITPSSATNGTLSSDDLTTLRADDSNYIILNNELYRLADKQHTSGILSYVHTGWDGTAMKDKSINITVSTRAWTLVVGQESGIKSYLHKTQGNVTNPGNQDVYQVTVYSKSTKSSAYTSSDVSGELVGANCYVFKSESGGAPISCMGVVNEGLQLFVALYNAAGTFITYLSGLPMSAFIAGSFTDTVTEL